ncbi:Gfo/Idh/MocA family oxidoreductase, partial [bacterium]|nr:Gfo/Idh/MocA family oxidoreductase [bacterium]
DRLSNELRDDFQIEILDSPEAVAERVDMVFIEALDGRSHLDYVKRTAPFKRPTFIDKPLAASVADAREIFRIAEEGGFPVMSCSSLRYADNLVEALGEENSGRILSCYAFGPISEDATHPWFFQYGIHTFEIVMAVMGPGCVEAQALKNDEQDVVALRWENGRVATMQGMQVGHKAFGVTIHREKGFRSLDLRMNDRPWYASMLDAIMKSLPHGKACIDPAETIEIIRMLEASAESRRTGRAVKI